MRRGLLSLALALVPSLAPASPTPPGPPAAPDKQREASRQFAQRLDHFADQLARRHVREVSREALLEAMITALFREARRPLPPDLRRQLGACATAAEPGQPPPLACPREDLLTRLRLGDGLDERRAWEVCCAAVTPLLDPHSGLISDADRRRAQGHENDRVGAGLVVSDDTGLSPMLVEAVLPGSPAARAGLRPGDRITHVAGAPLAKAAPAALRALKTHCASHHDLPLVPRDAPDAPKADAPPGVIRVEYVRPGHARPLAAEVLPGRFRAETVLGARRRGAGWDYFADAGLAHVRLTHLAKGTSDELRQALGGLGRRQLRGLVLDLRWCPGGFLNEAVAVAELFLGEATVATVQMRGRPDEVYRSTDGGKFRDFPLVVLVNGDTSGGAELIAASLQDHRRAVVVGSRTLGKASVQTPIALAAGMDFKVTSGTFARPGGQNLHRAAGATTADEWGVVPDEDFRVSPELGRRLRDWWASHSLRPAGDRERHPLDQPGADPQQAFALTLLRRRAEQATRLTAVAVRLPAWPRP